MPGVRWLWAVGLEAVVGVVPKLAQTHGCKAGVCIGIVLII